MACPRTLRVVGERDPRRPARERDRLRRRVRRPHRSDRAADGGRRTADGGRLKPTAPAPMR
ncbi:hypothetical protein SSAG_03684 [Streptomyces sp. Mg1]|nr:hypothetical protein SSAG_03684 [Streptomyces sp. Mg1]